MKPQHRSVPEDPTGYLRIPRSAYQSDPLWLEKRVFSRWEAWEWLLQAASFKARDWALKQSMRTVRLERGETPPLSTRYLAGVWGWDKMRVVRFLKMLGDEGMNKIRYSKRDSDGDTYLIVNYDSYETSRDTSRYTERDRSETDARQIRDTIEEGKQVTTSLPTGERNTRTRTRETGNRPSKRCPAAWQPNDAHRQLALTLGVDLVAELEVFRDYTFATARTDWDATLRNWLRNAAARHARTNGNGNGKAAPPAGEDAGELQRRRQQEMDRAEEEFQAQKMAWRKAIAERWESEEPAVRNRIREQAESEFASLRADASRFKRAVDPRAVQLYAAEINLPPPTKRTV